MGEFSEENIKKNCPHCDLNSLAFEYSLLITDNFSVVCDPNPIVEGHLLIIPKFHLSCIGEYSQELYEEFMKIYKKFSDFIYQEYGSVSTFEHGKFGQTVFHSHIHIFPYEGDFINIVPEGEDKLIKIKDLSKLKEIYEKEGGYLFSSMGNGKWVVDKNLTAPRFFRDRFAKALGHPERGNWKEMRENEILLDIFDKENRNVQEKYKNYISKLI